MSRLFCFGLGYSAETLAKRLAAKGWSIAGTARDPANVERLRAEGYDGHPLRRRAGQSGDRPPCSPAPRISCFRSRRAPKATPCSATTARSIAGLPTLDWIGYLSTVGVYGDQSGALVDETATPLPNNERTKARVVAESGWLALGEEIGRPVQVFRLAGIYGPGRSALDKLAAGTARRIVKPGQVFNRIHVEDIATVLEASMARPRAGAVYNVADDEPAPPEDVVTYAAELLGVEPPPEVPFEEAELTPMARSFYSNLRRVCNARIKSELGVELAYPSYREGLRGVLTEDL